MFYIFGCVVFYVDCSSSEVFVLENCCGLYLIIELILVIFFFGSVLECGVGFCVVVFCLSYMIFFLE